MRPTRFEIAHFAAVVVVCITMGIVGVPLWAVYVGLTVSSFVYGLGTFFESRARRRSQGPPLSR